MDARRFDNIKMLALGAALGFWFVFHAWDVAAADVPAVIFSLSWLGMAIWQKFAPRPSAEPSAA